MWQQQCLGNKTSSIEVLCIIFISFDNFNAVVDCMYQPMCLQIVCTNQCAYKLYVPTNVPTNCMYQQMCLQIVCTNQCVYNLYEPTNVPTNCMHQPMCPQIVCTNQIAHKNYLHSEENKMSLVPQWTRFTITCWCPPPPTAVPLCKNTMFTCNGHTILYTHCWCKQSCRYLCTTFALFPSFHAPDVHILCRHNLYLALGISLPPSTIP